MSSDIFEQPKDIVQELAAEGQNQFKRKKILVICYK